MEGGLEQEEREAASGRPLSGEKAQRIVDAMRRSVAQRGVAGSTFDHVSREAGVSRGLLHYYFGTKEQLLVEAARRECEVRLERMQRELPTAGSAEDYMALMAKNLRENVIEEPDFLPLIFELFTLSRRNAEIAQEFADLLRLTREQFSAMLSDAEEQGIIRLHAPADAVADIMFAIGDGMAVRMLGEPDRDYSASMAAAITCAATLLSA